MLINAEFPKIQEKYGTSVAARCSDAFDHILHSGFFFFYDKDSSVHVHGE